MSNHKYPRLDSIRRKASGRQCACCENKDHETVWVQWSYMRGEDEDYPVCQQHGQIARSNFKAFIDAIKERP